MPLRRLALFALAALLADAAGARPPAGAGPGRSEAAPLARLEIVDRGRGTEAWAWNLVHGPIEVRLRARRGHVETEPALPARATVPALDRTLVARVDRGDGELVLDVVPGHPGARPADVEYAWPLGTPVLRVGQGWGGRFSHADDENRYAVDFAAPEGTPVLAARDGVVMQVEGGFAEGGLDAPDDLGRANFVRVLHADGTMAVYAHLAPGGVQVRAGERVRRGQRIGTSGSTGYSGGPHLHFAVQANRGMRLVALPFRMFGPGGILRFSEPPPAPGP